MRLRHVALRSGLHLAVLLGVLLVPGRAAAAAVIAVPGDHTSIQQAIDAATSGDEIRVAAGVYVENLDFGQKDLVLVSTAGAAATILDGDAADAVITLNGQQTSACVIDGFTIRNGAGRDDGGQRWGGGVYMERSSPTIRNCVIRDNSVSGGNGGGLFASLGDPVIEDSDFIDNAAFEGGGFACEQSDFTFRRCTFVGNRSDAAGGAAGIWRSPGRFEDCVAEDNTSPTGGGISMRWNSSTVLERVTLRGNEASSGGGIDIFRSASHLIDCVIEDNTASDKGGGVFLQNAGEAVIERCIIRRNAANDTGGGGIYSIEGNGWRVVNALIHGNTARSFSGAGVLVDRDFGRIVNCTIARNDAGRPDAGAGAWAAGGSTLRMANSVLWENTVQGALWTAPPGPSGHTQAGADSESGVEPTNCNFGYDSPVAPPAGGGGNFGSNPLFRDADGGDFRVTGLSPNIDAGAGAALHVPSDDLDGRARPLDGDDDGASVVDIGAYEYVFGASPVDLVVTHDGQVVAGRFDLEPLPLGQWAQIPFAIENTSAAPHLLTGSPVVVVTPEDAFRVVTMPDASIPASGQVALVLEFRPLAPGPAQATVTIPNSATPDAPLTFDVAGGAELHADIVLTRGLVVWPGTEDVVAAAGHKDDLEVLLAGWAQLPAKVRARWKLVAGAKKVKGGALRLKPDGQGAFEARKAFRLKVKKKIRKLMVDGSTPVRLEIKARIKIPGQKGKTTLEISSELRIDDEAP